MALLSLTVTVLFLALAGYAIPALIVDRLTDE